MFKTLKAYILRLLPSFFNTEGNLSGTWKSSLELTKKNNDFTKFPRKRSEFLTQIIGDLSITYLPYFLNELSADKKITIAGKEFDWHGATHGKNLAYKTVKLSNSMVYVVQENPYSKVWFLNKLIFVSDDIYKVKSGGIYEYFVRQKSPNNQRQPTAESVG